MAWNDFFFCVGTMTLTGNVACLMLMCFNRWIERLDARQRKGFFQLVILLFLIPVIYPMMRWSRWMCVGGEWVHAGEFGTVAPARIRQIFGIVAMLWLSGLTVGIVIRALQYFRFRRILCCNIQMENPRWKWAMLPGKKKYGLKEFMTYENELVSTPLIVGTFRTRLIVPVQEYSEKEMRMMMEHELYHIHSRDLLWKKLGLWMTWLHWFNPLVYWVLNRLMLEQELACDFAVCDASEEFTAKEYCSLLYEMEAGGCEKVFSSALFESKAELERRIEEMKKRKNTLKLKSKMMVGCSALLILCAVIPAYAASEKVATWEEVWREQYTVATEIEPHATEGIVRERDNGSVREMWVENAVAMYGTAVQIELEAVANTRYLYSERELNAGDSIVIAVTSNDSSAPFKVGIKNLDTNELMYVSGTNTLVGTFTAETTGTYCAYIENNAQYKVSFTGSIIYPD